MLKRLVTSIFIACFFLNSLAPIPKAHADTLSTLPYPGTMVNLSSAFEPVLIKGLKVHPQNPFLFDFIIDTGSDKSFMAGPGRSSQSLKEQSTKLIKYFLASLTVPEKDLWVNLSPYEKDRMIASNLGQTEMGRDMLAQDYLLKQLTASLIYPERNLGKTFWDEVYTKAQEMYGTTQIPVNTFNKVWIVADKADVFEHENTAYIVGAHLRVMLEEDYLSLKKHQEIDSNINAIDPAALATPNDVASIGANIIRKIILPQIEKEVNEGKNFAELRQMFYSMILASWYKVALKEAILTQIYGNQSKVKAGINQPDPRANDEIFNRYLQAYKKGVFNYIRDDIDQSTNQISPRKYFSGGLQIRVGKVLNRITDFAMMPQGDSLGAVGNGLIEMPVILRSVFHNHHIETSSPEDAAMSIGKEKLKIRNKERTNQIVSSILREFTLNLEIKAVPSANELGKIWKFNDIRYYWEVLDGLEVTTNQMPDGEEVKARLKEAIRKKKESLKNMGEFNLTAVVELIWKDFGDRNRKDLHSQSELSEKLGASPSTFSKDNYKKILTALEEKIARSAKSNKTARLTAAIKKKRKSLEVQKFDMDKTIEKIDKYFDNPENTAFPTNKQLSKLVGPSTFVFFQNGYAIVLKLQRRISDGVYDENPERKKRLSDAVADQKKLLEARQKFDLEKTINQIIADFGSTNRDQLHDPVELSEIFGLSVTTFKTHYQEILLELEKRINQGKYERALSDRLNAAISRKRQEQEVHRKRVSKKTNAAMIVADPFVKGGIDFDRSKMKMNILKEGPGVQMQFDPATIARIKRDGFEGMDFEIEKIIPVVNLPFLLGLSSSK